MYIVCTSQEGNGSLSHLHDFPRNSGAFCHPLERDRSSSSLILLESHCCVICSNGSISRAVNSIFCGPFWCASGQEHASGQEQRGQCARGTVFHDARASEELMWEITMQIPSEHFPPCCCNPQAWLDLPEGRGFLSFQPFSSVHH